MDRKTMNNVEKLKIAVTYGIGGLFALCTAHCGFLVLGYDLLIVHLLACVYSVLLGICLSRLFGMCVLHRCMVFYITSVLTCIVLRKYGIFGEYLFQARLLMFAIGIIISTLVIWKRICQKR